MNRVRLAAWRSALDLSATDLPSEERTQAVTGIVASLRASLDGYTTRIDAIQERMERTSRVQRSHSNLLVRSALAAGFTLFLAPAAGCYLSNAPTSPDLDAHDVADGPFDGISDGALDAPADTGAPEADAGDAPCTPEETRNEYDRARWSLAIAPCPPCAPDPPSDIPYGIAIDSTGRIVDVRRGDGAPVPDDVRSCYLEALAGETFPCLAGDEVWQECVICIF
jgi:hypothetical protein